MSETYIKHVPFDKKSFFFSKNVAVRPINQEDISCVETSGKSTFPLSTGVSVAYT